jgi:hypothetical protein
MHQIYNKPQLRAEIEGGIFAITYLIVSLFATTFVNDFKKAAKIFCK